MAGVEKLPRDAPQGLRLRPPREVRHAAAPIAPIFALAKLLHEPYPMFPGIYRRSWRAANLKASQHRPAMASGVPPECIANLVFSEESKVATVQGAATAPGARPDAAEVHPRPNSRF